MAAMARRRDLILRGGYANIRRVTASDTSGLVHALVLDGRGGGEALDWDGVERWRPEHGVLWIHLDYAATDAEAWLGMRSGLDAVTRESLLDKDPRPRALPVGDALLLVIRGINLNQGAEPEDMVSIRCWVEAGRIVTLRHRRVHAMRELLGNLSAGKGPRSAGELLAAIVDNVLDPVVTCVDTVDDDVARLEEVALTASAPELRARLADLRRRAISLRRFIGPQREAFGKLAALTAPWLGDDDRARLRESADRMTRTVEELDAARDRAAVTHEEVAGRLSEVASQRLYVLSLITAVFLPLGFVTSLFGVNVGGIPGRDNDAGFWILCAVFLTAVLSQLWLFRRWRWL
jgi:zinc transporter